MAFFSVQAAVGSRSARRRQRRNRVIRWGVFAVGCTGLIVGVTMLFARVREREDPCARNMKLIGAALRAYAKEHEHGYPPDLGTLAANSDIPTKAFICPQTGQAPAGSRGVADVNGHVSYIYVGGGRMENGSAEVVLLYGPLLEHGGMGMNVLYGDGRVVFVAKGEARELVKELEAGHNPPVPIKSR